MGKTKINHPPNHHFCRWYVYHSQMGCFCRASGHRPRTLTPAPAAAAKPPLARCRNRNAPRMARDPLENSTGGDVMHGDSTNFGGIMAK